MRLLFLLLVAFAVQTSHAQVWLEAGGRAGLGLSGYVNKNLFNDDQHDYSFDLGLVYGPVVGLNFGDYHGLTLELMLAQNQQQLSYHGDTTAERSPHNTLIWKTSEFNLLYRFYTDQGAYIEIGPKLAHVRSVKQSYGADRLEVDTKYNDSYYSAILGFGAFLAANETLTLKLGLRGEYALSDLVSEEGKKDGFPAYYKTFDSYTPTKPLRVSIGLELTFGIGGVAKAGCGHRNLVFGTQYRR